MRLATLSLPSKGMSPSPNTCFKKLTLDLVTYALTFNALPGDLKGESASLLELRRSFLKLRKQDASQRHLICT